ncbi:hypothetical protein [Paenibacillus bovis]|uniref:Uncharacterized protein n=1 Tax=Paenibacillus bovis TaxID=1616788 RepID=A0A172ZKV6_9BACL|nr:hypothetical protein [Paenibacillus bovis]ANF98218.1 hypothetical protein AR543_20840 [Paenibacillus bovis]
MIPFNQAWPYDIVMNDVYIQECPFCHTNNVLLPIPPKELATIHNGKKKLLVFPCCSNRVTLLDSDSDYLLTDTILR